MEPAATMLNVGRAVFYLGSSRPRGLWQVVKEEMKCLNRRMFKQSLNNHVIA
jgi:hypothetical protein